MKGTIKLHPEAPRFDRNGYLLDIEGNRPFLNRLRSTPSLSAVELLRHSRAFRHSAATRSLADHLLANAIRIEAASHRLGDTGKHSPFFLELLAEVPRAAEGREPAGDEESDLEPTSDPSEPEHAEPPEIDIPGVPEYPEICEFKCAWWTVFFLGTGLLMEDCGHGWHVIGVCLEG